VHGDNVGPENLSRRQASPPFVATTLAIRGKPRRAGSQHPARVRRPRGGRFGTFSRLSSRPANTFARALSSLTGSGTSTEQRCSPSARANLRSFTGSATSTLQRCSPFQDGHLLPLTFEGATGGEDLFDEMRRSVGARLEMRCGTIASLRRSAFVAKPRIRRERCLTGGANNRQWVAAFEAKIGIGRIRATARRALHTRSSFPISAARSGAPIARKRRCASRSSFSRPFFVAPNADELGALDTDEGFESRCAGLPD
jgi:hypothetical protein